MPIARLLGISTDELLSYQQELTAEEIGEILKKATVMLEEIPDPETYEAASRLELATIEKEEDRAKSFSKNCAKIC